MKKKIKFTDDLSSITELLDSKSHIIPLGVDDDNLSEVADIPAVLPILALRSSVLFPGSITPITVGRKKSMTLVKEVEKNGGYLGAVLQKDGTIQEPEFEDLYTIGAAAKILKVLEMPDGNLTVILHAVEKIEVVKFTASEPYFMGEVQVIRDPVIVKNSAKFDALVESVKELAINLISISGSIPKEAMFAIKNIDSKRGVLNFICSNIEFHDSVRQKLLEAPSLQTRAQFLLEILVKEHQLQQLKNEIQQKVKEDIDTQQREYYLNQQMRTIQEELGGDPADKEIEQMRIDAASKQWPEQIAELFEKEISKLERMNPAVAEFSVQVNYLQLLLELPWSQTTKDNLNLKHAQKCLDADHFGLEEVKDRIIEHLAVLKLRGDLKSPIICLYGPPGVGKTSLGKSVARALKRKFGRISLGGLHDESEIRGHRRTYVGAMPGRIIQTIRRCGSSNPVIILDEIDKVTAGAHGDPSSALLEVLDPEQNTTFHDNYLDTEYDLSKVLFIATANNVSAIPTALRDRMEMINISGYLPQEKNQIALKHLVPKQIEAHGLTSRQLKLREAALDKIVAEYTRESGVRTLDKLLAKIARFRAKDIGLEKEFKAEVSVADIETILGVPRYKYDSYEGNDSIGVVMGLAWTQVGGDILYIESSINKGKGGLVLTGNLGDVMKESASIALGWVKAHCEELGIDAEIFEKSDIHIHVPEGAVPKDGPSAGITLVTSLVSLLTGRKVNERVAMSGETTLRGKVLPVGGLKEKLLAAKRAGVKTVFVSRENEKDISEINQEYLEGVTMRYVSTLSEVIDGALEAK